MGRLQSTAVEDADSRGHARIKTLKNGGDDDGCENTNDEGAGSQAGQWTWSTGQSAQTASVTTETAGIITHPMSRRLGALVPEFTTDTY